MSSIQSCQEPTDGYSRYRLRVERGIAGDPSSRIRQHMVALHEDSDSRYDSQWENPYYLSRQGLYATFPHANDTPVYRGEVVVRHGHRLKRLLPLDTERWYIYNLDDIEPSSRSQCLWCGSVGKTASLLKRRHPTHCKVNEARDLDLWFQRAQDAKG